MRKLTFLFKGHPWQFLEMMWKKLLLLIFQRLTTMDRLPQAIPKQRRLGDLGTRPENQAFVPEFCGWTLCCCNSWGRTTVSTCKSNCQLFDRILPMSQSSLEIVIVVRDCWGFLLLLQEILREQNGTTHIFETRCTCQLSKAHKTTSWNFAEYCFKCSTQWMAVSDSSGSSNGCFLGVLQVSPIIFDGLSFPSGGVGVSAWTQGLGIMVKVSDLMEVSYLAVNGESLNMTNLTKKPESTSE